MHRPLPQPQTFTGSSRWRKKASHLRCSVPLLVLPFVVVLFFLFKFPSPTGTLISEHGGRRCRSGDGEEKFLWYAPHSGFSNQLSEFRNAVLFAGILNRTLVVPPVLDHHAVALGSCPKFRVTSPRDLRAQVWDHAMELLRSGRYVSMTDIVDVSTLLSNGMVRMIDFRIFIAKWCALSMQPPCFIQKSQPDMLKQCRSSLSGIDGNIENCSYAVEDDCRTTVWTYKQNQDDVADIFQPDEELQRKKRTSYFRKRRDLFNSFGPGTDAGKSTLLAFGTLFSGPYRDSELYIDIPRVNTDTRIQSMLEKIDFLPFVPEILTAGKEYAHNIIKEPYMCAQLRLLDGQFKNHWKATFFSLRQQIESLRSERKKSNNSAPINIFIMTDLPSSNWTGTYLSELARDFEAFKIHLLKDDDHLVTRTAKNVISAQHGLHTSFLTENNEPKGEIQVCKFQSPDILLFLEETICSCAALGFVGTSGSTIADSIGRMRQNKICVS